MPAWLAWIRPPVLMLLSLGLGALAAWLVPGAPFVPDGARWLGAVPLLGGFGLIGWCARMFDRAGTPIVPGEPSTALLTAGPYRYTRNPIYCGMALMLLGAAVLVGRAAGFIAPVLYVVAVTGLFIGREERLLEARFGAEYLAYKSRIPRWLPRLP